MPQISIIVPVYKAENYLKDCIDSILHQTFTDFELILIDDGSPDNSGKICDDYALNDKRIKVVHKQNGGQSTARNVGLDYAKGDYIIFVDADDIVAPDLFASLLKAITENEVDIAVCKFKAFKEINEIKTYKITENIELLNNDAIMRDLVDNDKINFSPWCKIYKKEIFITLRFKEGIIFEDMQLMYQVWSKVSKVAILDKELYFYRNNPNSTLNSKYNEKHLVEYDIRNEIYMFYNKNYPQYASGVYAHWMFSSVLMYLKITKNYYQNKSKYEYLLKFDKRILKESKKQNIKKNIKLGTLLYLLAPNLLILTLKIKYKL